jgi:hypothetical protein
LKINLKRIKNHVTTFSVVALLLVLVVSPANLGILNYAQADQTSVSNTDPSTKGGSLDIKATAGASIGTGSSSASVASNAKSLGTATLQTASAATAKTSTPASGHVLPALPVPSKFASSLSSSPLTASDPSNPVKVVNIQIPTGGTTETANQYSGLESSNSNCCGVTPSDGGFTVSPNHIISVVNNEMKVWDKAGNLQFTCSIAPGGCFGAILGQFGDPRVVYDPQSGHIFFTQLDINFVNNGYVDVWTTNNVDDPSSWFGYGIPFSDVIPDQPRLAVDDVKVSIVASNYACATCGWTGEEFNFIDKANLLAQAPTLQTLGPYVSVFHEEPALVPASNGGETFMVTNFQAICGGGFDHVVGWTGTAGSIVEANDYCVPVAGPTGPPGGQQPGTSTLVPTNDARIGSASMVGSYMSWVANDGCVNSGFHSCVRFDVFNTAGSGALVQDIDVSQAGTDMFFPAITTGSSGGIPFGIIFGYSSPANYPSIGFMGQSACSAFGTIDNVVNSRTGSADEFTGRHGDYSGEFYDPTTGNMYGLSEYNAPGAGWNTFVSINSVTCGVSAHPTTLTLDSISNQKWGATFSVSGKLTDNSAAGIGIANQVVTFTSSAGGSVVSATTGSDGSFVAVAVAPGAPAAAGKFVQAHYAGALFYGSTDSIVRNYNTLVHSTSLSQFTPVNVPWGLGTSFKAILVDTSAGSTPIASETITWTGTGVIGVAGVATDSVGTAIGTGTAPTTVGSGWTVQSHFAGDSSYAAANSVVRNYNTLLHTTKVIQAFVHSVPWGQPTQLTALLVDASNGGVGIASKTITWTGTGVIGSAPVATDSFGSAPGAGTAPTTVATGWTVQSHFAGDSLYAASNSNTKTYNTVAHNTRLSLVITPSTVVHGGTYQVSGNLSDAVLGVVLGSMPITFTADAPIVIGSTSTGATSGDYLVSGLTAPTAVSTFNIQSHFAGTTLYAAHNSLTKTLKTT